MSELDTYLQALFDPNIKKLVELLITKFVYGERINGAVYLIGPKTNGKTKFVEFLKKLFGDYMVYKQLGKGIDPYWCDTKLVVYYDEYDKSEVKRYTAAKHSKKVIISGCKVDQYPIEFNTLVVLDELPNDDLKKIVIQFNNNPEDVSIDKLINACKQKYPDYKDFCIKHKVYTEFKDNAIDPVIVNYN